MGRGANGGETMSSHLDYEINKELGECYLFMGELDKAEEYYRKAVTCNGIHSDPYLGLATIAVQRGDLDSAIGLYQKAHQIAASDKSLAGMALIELERGEHDAALEHFSAALAANPSNLVALFGLVQVGHLASCLEKVVPHLKNYLAMDPGKHEVRFSLAGCLVWMDRKEEAKRELTTLLEISPDYEPARELLGQI
jgi:tetratricopeptide (TPR) repeat protein